jgi:spermidine/putrescine transport system substrate-binding protein
MARRRDLDGAGPLNGVTRRAFLRAAGAAVILGACGKAARRNATTGVLPIHPDNPPVDPALPIERGASLRVYQWRDYLAPDVVERFARRHAIDDVDVAVESFTTMPEAVARLRSPDGDFDVVFPTMEALPGLVAERLLLPLAAELVPNGRNLWPFFQEGPFYDPGQRYSVPYTVYTTGIGWRRDLVPAADAPPRLDNPYDIFWDPRYRGAVGIYDDYREAIALALLRRGEDPNTRDDGVLARAVDDLIEMAGAVDVEVSAEGAYQELQTGDYAVQQSWSGDLLSARRFGASPARGADSIEFTWPEGGVVGCDLTAICSRGRSPVLAHAFLDHLLDEGIAMRNFAWNGYQPPVGAAEPASLFSSRWAGIVPANLRETILAPRDLVRGRFLVPLPAEVDARWRLGWERFLQAA